ncbi:MAG: hypothetical protein RMN52_16300 [Anaerolineae bacterium]|nr:WD40 repeat domain-containing protein [Candidatus Roseilinea sp.]MDW8451561.1 hypothetical protein [Anaerolineae bacterium]
MHRVAPLVHLGSGSVSQLIPSPDGRRLAVVASAGVHVYDATQLSQQYALTHFIEKTDVTDAAFSPTGETLAVLHSSGTYVISRAALVLLDAGSGRELRRLDPSPYPAMPNTLRLLHKVSAWP